MQRIMMWLLIATLAMVPLGCFKAEMKVVVKPDGSGTITETMGILQQTIEMMKSRAESMKEMGREEEEETEGEEAEEKELSFEEEFESQEKAKAEVKTKEFGEDVKLVSFNKETQGNMVCFTAVYSFEDINKVKAKLSTESPMKGKPAEEKVEQKPVTFSFKQLPDKTAELIVNMPSPIKPKEEGEAETEEAEAEEGVDMEDPQVQQMMQMFKGMRFSFVLVCGGEIIETNATWQGNNQITLLDMDWEELLGSVENIKKMKALQRKYPQPPESPGEIAKILEAEGIEGIKFEVNKKVKVKFK